jgi:hypothetical protein
MGAMLRIAVMALIAAAAPGKLAAPVGKEMGEAVLAVNKSLGLESWPSYGVHPCVDRGGPANPAKDVSHDDAQRCAGEALDKGLPGLGHSYVVAVLMAPMGPVTVMALGVEEAEGWAAYSCDPKRKCAPIRLDAGTKWGKRVVDWRAKACADEQTLWFPEGRRSCP